jgi:hypothetical protein
VTCLLFDEASRLFAERISPHSSDADPRAAKVNEELAWGPRELPACSTRCCSRREAPPSVSFQAGTRPRTRPNWGSCRLVSCLKSVDANIGLCLSPAPPMRTRVADGSATKRRLIGGAVSHGARGSAAGSNHRVARAGGRYLTLLAAVSAELLPPRAGPHFRPGADGIS